MVREASKRVLGLRPFDVQLIGMLTTSTLKSPVAVGLFVHIDCQLRSFPLCFPLNLCHF